MRSFIQSIADTLSINAADWLIGRIPSHLIQFTNSRGYADGAGAQIQRILSLIAFSKKYKVDFYFNPIDNVELQPIDNLTGEDELRKNIGDLNQWVLNRFGVPIQTGLVRTLDVSGVNSLVRKLCAVYLRDRLHMKVETTCLSLLDAYFETRVNPETWILLNEDQSGLLGGEKNQKCVHVHLRLSTFSHSSDRSVSMDYYRSILDDLMSRAEFENYTLQIIVHTDFLGSITDKALLHQVAVPQSLSYWVRLGLLREDFSINSDLLESAREALTNLISDYPNARVFNDKSWVYEWEEMASADFLVTSKSSFSIVGGILNPYGIKFVPNSWDLSIPGWIAVPS